MGLFDKKPKLKTETVLFVQKRVEMPALYSTYIEYLNDVDGHVKGDFDILHFEETNRKGNPYITIHYYTNEQRGVITFNDGFEFEVGECKVNKGDYTLSTSEPAVTVHKFGEKKYNCKGIIRMISILNSINKTKIKASPFYDINNLDDDSDKAIEFTFINIDPNSADDLFAEGLNAKGEKYAYFRTEDGIRALNKAQAQMAKAKAAAEAEAKAKAAAEAEAKAKADAEAAAKAKAEAEERMRIEAEAKAKAEAEAKAKAEAEAKAKAEAEAKARAEAAARAEAEAKARAAEEYAKAKAAADAQAGTAEARAKAEAEAKARAEAEAQAQAAAEAAEKAKADAEAARAAVEKERAAAEAAKAQAAAQAEQLRAQAQADIAAAEEAKKAAEAEAAAAAEKARKALAKQQMKQMLMDGMPPKMVAKYTGFTEEECQKVADALALLGDL